MRGTSGGDSSADERKYGEDEVNEIFDLAVSRDDIGRPAVSDPRGLTLSQLQEVGREVGVEPSRIAEAALAVDTKREVLPRRKYLGLPISVGRTVELSRGVTDREWAVLVAELRETFGARGRVTSQGGIREWSNSNLHVFLEPTETGHRLRMRTLKGNAMPLLTMGVAGLTMGLIVLTAFLTTGTTPVSMELALMWSLLMGGGGLASGLSLPRWARERERQMEYIAGRVRGLTEERPEGEDLGV